MGGTIATQRLGKHRVNSVAKILAWPLLLLALAYVLACGFLYAAQASFLYHPTAARPGDAASRFLLHRDGIDLMVSSRDRDGPQAVLYFGGNAEDVTDSLPELASTFPDSAIYALHYRGYGGSGGAPTERDLVGDGRALFDVIHRTHPQVTVIGRSLGSGVALQVAAARPASRLVLVTPYDSIAALASQRFTLFPVNWLLRDRYESWRYAPRISVPTTVIAARNDQVIPRASTERLLAKFKPGLASYIVIPGVGHNDISANTRYAAALRDGR